MVNSHYNFYKSSLKDCSFFYLIESECLMLMGFDNSEIDKLIVIHSIVIVPKDNHI